MSADPSVEKIDLQQVLPDLFASELSTVALSISSTAQFSSSRARCLEMLREVASSDLTTIFDQQDISLSNPKETVADILGKKKKRKHNGKKSKAKGMYLRLMFEIEMDMNPNGESTNSLSDAFFSEESEMSEYRINDGPDDLVLIIPTVLAKCLSYLEIHGKFGNMAC